MLLACTCASEVTSRPTSWPESGAISGHSHATGLIAEAARTAGGDAAVNRQKPEVNPGMIEHATHGPPLCKGHQERCVKKRVNKSGPNKGEHLPSLHGCLKALKAFMTCTTRCMFSILIGSCASAL